MKRIISLAAITAFMLLSFHTVSAQIRKVPAAVTEAFKAKYPNATNVEWKDKITNGFAADFDLNGGHKHEARFTTKGEWRYTEQEIGENGLPEAIKEGIKKSKYAEWEIRTAYRIDLPNDVTQYRAQVKKGDIQKKNLLFNNEGRLLKDNITL